MGKAGTKLILTLGEPGSCLPSIIIHSFMNSFIQWIWSQAEQCWTPKASEAPSLKVGGGRATPSEPPVVSAGAGRIRPKRVIEGFPGGAVVENLPANAGDTGSSPGLGRSHVPRSNWAREPQLLSLRVRSLCSATREAAIVRGPCTAMKSGPRSPQLEKALAQKRRPNIAINQSINQ